MDTQTKASIYHDGEMRVQTRAGSRDSASRSERMLSNAIPKRAITFVSQQIMAVIGSVDEVGQPWCSILFGERGFIQALDMHTLALNTKRMGITEIDPFWRNIQSHTSVGVLLIELHTRRRLRINGQLYRTSEHECTLHIDQAYPNCPKYIQRRHVRRMEPDFKPSGKMLEQGTNLSAAQRQWIAQADTFFVASAQRDAIGKFQVDASHRGGQPGFIQVINNQLLRIPDFTGNNLFNTLGNFFAYPKAGLVFIDFAKNLILQLTGRPRILWDLDVPIDTSGGTRRYWQFQIVHWRMYGIPFNIDWELLDYSPYLL